MSGAAPAPLMLRYEVRLEPGLRTGETRICFDGPAPHALRPIAGTGPLLIGSARTSRGRTLPRVDGAVLLEGLAATECVEYRFALPDRGFVGVRREGALLTSQDAWLLRPNEVTTASLVVRPPAGESVSLPWGGDGARTRLPASALALPGHVAVGRLAHRHFERSGATVDLALLPGELSLSADGLARAVAADVAAVASVYGRFPVEHLQVVVLPVGPAMDDGPPDPIAFGLVRRGGGASVLLMVREDADEQAVAGHWVGPHELSHLLVPFIDRRQAWLSEGLATYYQEVARVRVGLEDEQTAWQRIVDGLARGAADARAQGPVPLVRAAASMRATGHFHRVYWSGLAFVLEAEVALRARSSSLDVLLCSASRRLRAQLGPVSGGHVLRELDDSLGAPLLAPMAETWSARTEFPDSSPTLTRLGVIVGEDGRVSLDESASLAGTRRAIMAPDQWRTISAGSCR